MDALRRILQNHPCEIAAVILEPVCTSHGVVPPQPGYLAAVRELTREWGVLLVFDETATGFRMGRGGAQEFYGVSPDLTVLGRALGGGLPIGALCGRAELISLLAPDGPLFQSGTFSGNPLAMAAGLAVLEAMEDDRGYAVLEARGAYLERALVEAASAARVTVQVQRVASMMTLYFHPRPVTRWSEVSRCDTRAFAAFARGMYPRGVYLPPAPFETMYLSLAHTSEDLDFIAARAAEAFLEV